MLHLTVDIGNTQADTDRHRPALLHNIARKTLGSGFISQGLNFRGVLSLRKAAPATALTAGGQFTYCERSAGALRRCKAEET